MIPEYALTEMAIFNQQGMTASGVFKNTAGEQQSDTYPCRISESRYQPNKESEQNEQLKSETIWEIALPKGTPPPNASWVFFAEFPDGREAEYYLSSILGPESHDSQLTILALKVD